MTEGQIVAVILGGYAAALIAAWCFGYYGMEYLDRRKQARAKRRSAWASSAS